MSFPGYRNGSGEPLVLVHGLGSRWQVFEPVLDDLATEFEVLAVDLPGFGAQPLVDGVTAGVPGYAAWLAEQFPLWGIERPHVAGNSMGAGVALELARTGQVRSAVAFAPIGFWGRSGLRWCQGLLTGLRATGRALEPVLPRLVNTKAGRVSLMGAAVAHPVSVSPQTALLQADGLLHSPGFPAARDSFSSYTWHAESDRGQLGTVPHTVVWGSRDVLLTAKPQARRAKLYLPDAEHVTLPGAGHVPFHDDPQGCIKAIVTTTKRANA